MEGLNSAGRKYFLHVSMNKTVHRTTIAVDPGTVELWPQKVLIIEQRISPIVI